MPLVCCSRRLRSSARFSDNSNLLLEGPGDTGSSDPGRCFRGEVFPGELSWIVLAVAIYSQVVQSGGIRRFKKQRETCSDSSWSCAECLILSTSAFRFASKAPAQRDGWRYEAESAKPCSAARTSCLSFAICSGDNACAIAQANQHRLGAATDNTLRRHYDNTTSTLSLRCATIPVAKSMVNNRDLVQFPKQYQ